MKICAYLSEKTVIDSLQSKTKEEVLREIVKALYERGVLDSIDKYFQALMEREKLCTTGIGKGVAIPHAKMKNVENIIVSFARSLEGVDFSSIDKKPVHFIFTIFTPEDVPEDYLLVLAKISKIAKDEYFREKVMQAKNAAEIMEVFRKEDEKFEEGSG